MKWFRFYNEARRDPKIQQLSDWQFRVWVEILCVAAEYDGEIPVADLTRLLRRRKDHLKKAINDLVRLELLEQGGGILIPHNWFGRQYKSDTSTDRVQRFRLRQNHRYGNVSQRNNETAPDRKQVSKKEKRLSDDGTSLDAEIQLTDLANLTNITPLTKWKG